LIWPDCSRKNDLFNGPSSDVKMVIWIGCSVFKVNYLIPVLLGYL
jgi:hypothetical protein